MRWENRDQVSDWPHFHETGDVDMDDCDTEDIDESGTTSDRVSEDTSNVHEESRTDGEDTLSG